ncbi:MAG: hypothetical protein QNJ53_28890 [Pleurocapsa sp. MO_192.B19]|nr:hypothetical protein [Pleurocapsa sp. MO_192.B19]
MSTASLRTKFQASQGLCPDYLYRLKVIAQISAIISWENLRLMAIAP